jgi:hypothetical protein
MRGAHRLSFISTRCIANGRLPQWYFHAIVVSISIYRALKEHQITFRIMSALVRVPRRNQGPGVRHSIAMFQALPPRLFDSARAVIRQAPSAPERNPGLAAH